MKRKALIYDISLRNIPSISATETQFNESGAGGLLFF